MRMKKTITFFLSCLMAVAAFATDYKGDLKITVMSNTTVDYDRVVTVELTDVANSLYRLSIKDFKYITMSLGDIVIEGAQGEKQEDGSVVLKTTNYSLTVKIGVDVPVSVNFEGVISKDEQTFTITKLDIETGTAAGTVVCDFTGTKVDASAIKDVTFESGECLIYNIAGQKVQDMNQSGIYFVRYANGTTKKVIKK